MIHPTAIIGNDVELHGTDISIGAYAVIDAPCRIHSPAYIGPHAVIGAPPQHHGSYPSPMHAKKRAAGVIINAGATIREFATIHQGCVAPTVIGAHALVMAGCHIAHDCSIGADTTLGSFSVLGGFTQVGPKVTFGQGVITHPWVLIGEGAMVGLNSSIIKDVLPYAKAAGAPARILGSNTHRDPSLPADYEEMAISGEIWEEWAIMQAKREAQRAAWANA
jgi:UDP-N-acetylglucosamine acyltransferase